MRDPHEGLSEGKEGGACAMIMIANCTFELGCGGTVLAWVRCLAMIPHRGPLRAAEDATEIGCGAREIRRCGVLRRGVRCGEAWVEALREEEAEGAAHAQRKLQSRREQAQSKQREVAEMKERRQRSR
eukprot:3356425-Rhodomonas_salina.2